MSTNSTRRATALPVGLHPRCVSDHRSTRGQLEQRVLVPPTTFAQVVSVIADQQHDRVGAMGRGIQRVQHFADLRVDEGRTGVVGPKELTPLLVAELVERFLPAAGDGQRHVRRAVGRIAMQLDLIQRISFEVSRWGNEGVMRLVKSDRQEEWLFTGVPQEVDRQLGDLPVGLIQFVAFGRRPAAPFDFSVRSGCDRFRVGRVR